MIWGLRHGRAYATSYGTMLINKMDVPDEWVNPPVIPRHLLWVRDAFYKLATCRETGFGVGRIPWTAIIKYAEYMGLDENETYRFENIILSLDVEVCKYIDEKQKAEAKKKNKKK